MSPAYEIPNEFDALPDAALITREHAIAAAQNALRNQGYAVAKHLEAALAQPCQECAMRAANDEMDDAVHIAAPWEKRASLCGQWNRRNLQPYDAERPDGWGGCWTCMQIACWIDKAAEAEVAALRERLAEAERERDEWQGYEIEWRSRVEVAEAKLAEAERERDVRLTEDEARVLAFKYDDAKETIVQLRERVRWQAEWRDEAERQLEQARSDLTLAQVRISTARDMCARPTGVCFPAREEETA